MGLMSFTIRYEKNRDETTQQVRNLGQVVSG